jgi:CRP/FNR family transcriptional regulator, cyclic AMP receptor protein
MAKDIHESLLFAGVSRDYVEQFLASLPEPVHLKKGEFLWRQDDSGNSMYLLKNGKMDVLIHTRTGGQEHHIASIETGAVLGEVCVFGEKTRSASIRAAEDSELLVIEGEQFLQKVHKKEVGVLMMCYNVTKLLTQRLIAANEFIRKIQLMTDKPSVKSELEQYRQRFFHESLFN